jgi:hypothetical protein
MNVVSTVLIHLQSFVLVAKLIRSIKHEKARTHPGVGADNDSNRRCGLSGTLAFLVRPAGQRSRSASLPLP